MMPTFSPTRRLAGAGALLALIASTTFAATAIAKTASPKEPAKEYEACTTLTQQHPAEALTAAEYWAGKGGGSLATHCKGLAQMALGQFDAASKTFLSLAENQKAKFSAATRARLFAQAAQAAFSGGNPERASALLGNSITLQPDVQNFRIDRSITYAFVANYDAAIRELTAVLEKDAGNIAALTFRASAYRSMNRLAEAEADITQALLIQPDKPEALLERGAIRAVSGNVKGAQEDWEKIIRIVPDSAASKIAQENLAKMQGKQK